MAVCGFVDGSVCVGFCEMNQCQRLREAEEKKKKKKRLESVGKWN